MRNIHSLQALKHFEAAARHQSFKQAANELFVTPTAVSHHIKNLEEQLNCVLFERQTRKVSLTRAGQVLYHSLFNAFNQIDDTIKELTAHEDRQVVTLGLGSIIGTRWLAPRLGSFWSQHPEIDLRLQHSSLPGQKNPDQFDLAIAWGDGNWPHSQHQPFIEIQVSPVMAPTIQAPASEAALIDFPLIHQSNRQNWQQWFQAAGIEEDIEHTGIVIDDANLILQATINGQGIALGILPFIEEELSTGKLQQPFDLTITPKQAYYLLYQQRSLQKPAVKAVYEWLIGQIVS